MPIPAAVTSMIGSFVQPPSRSCVPGYLNWRRAAACVQPVQGCGCGSSICPTMHVTFRSTSREEAGFGRLTFWTPSPHQIRYASGDPGLALYTYTVSLNRASRDSSIGGHHGLARGSRHGQCAGNERENAMPVTVAVNEPETVVHKGAWGLAKTGSLTCADTGRQGAGADIPIPRTLGDVVRHDEWSTTVKAVRWELHHAEDPSFRSGNWG